MGPHAPIIHLGMNSSAALACDPFLFGLPVEKDEERYRKKKTEKKGEKSRYNSSNAWKST